MFPANTYDGMIQRLCNAFYERYENDLVRMIGILFAKPHRIEPMRDSTLDIATYDERSGERIDFFCAGYLTPGEAALRCFGDEVPVMIPRFRKSWHFSTKAFDQFRSEVSQRSRWRYSGNVDLILLDVRRTSPETCDARLDFSKAICLDIRSPEASSSDFTINGLFERICEYAENPKKGSPTSGFSDLQGGRFIKAGFLEFLLSLLPKWLGQEARKAAQFAVKDISH